MGAVQLLRVSVHERISAAAEDFLLRVETGEEAARVPALRPLLTERLTAAAEEIVGLFQETVAEYEDRVQRAQREICRQRRLLDAVLKPEVKLHRADVQQLRKDQAPPEDGSPGLDQDPPEPPHIKEEQEDLWSSQEEADLTTFTFSPVPVKSEEEEEEEEAQSSQLHQSQTEHVETDEEDCGGPEPAWNPDPDLEPVSDDKAADFSVAEIEVSCDDWEERAPPSGSGSGERDGGSVRDLGCGSPDKPFSCSVCGKKYTKKGYLLQHMAVHRGERRRSCSVCSRRLVWHAGVECHTCVGGARRNSGSKSPSFSECDRRRCYSHHLKTDAHSDENLFSCSVCARKFTQRGYLIQHMARHTGKIRFRCCVCDQRFAWRHELKSHQCAGDSSELHRAEQPRADGEDRGGSDSDDKTSDSSEPETEVTDEDGKEIREFQSETARPVGADRKSFICSECGKTFNGEENLKIHMKTHAGEKPFSCSFCEKGFTQRGYLTNHMTAHTEEKRFLYCVCGKRFAWRYNLKNHKCAGESAQLHPGPSERNREAEPAAGCSRTSLSPGLQAGVAADDWKTKEPPSTLNSLPDRVLQADAAERPFSCSQCGKGFRRKKNLQEHVRIHTGEKPYGCSVCMKYFSCSGSLRKHLRIHTGEKPFSCSVCGNRFTESGHLKVHMRTHTGEKPFSCSVCGKSFTWRQSFNNHMKYHSETRREVN